MAKEKKSGWGGIIAIGALIAVVTLLLKGRSAGAAPPPPPPPPPPVGVLSLENLQISNAFPLVGESVTISAVATTDVSGTYSVSLMVNGAVVQTQNIMITPAQSLPVSFIYTPAGAGLYTVAIGSLTGNFQVVTDPYGTSPTEFIVPQYPAPTDAAALKNKILASPYRGGGGYPAVALKRWDGLSSVSIDAQNAEIPNYIMPDGDIGRWYGPLYLVSADYMAYAVQFLPTWARDIYLLMAGLPAGTPPPVTYRLNVSKQGGGVISATKPKAGLSYNINAGMTVTMTAIPAAGYRFRSWSWPSNPDPNYANWTENPTSWPMIEEISIMAVFDPL